MGIACGWALLALSIGTTVEIFARKFFDFSFAGIDEISGYMLAVTSAAGFTWALVRRSHMRITLLFPYVSPNVRSALNVLAMATLAAMAAFCAVRGWAEFAANWESGKPANTPLQTPLWIPQGLWFLGLLTFAVVCVWAAVHAAWLSAKDRARLDRLYGPQTLDEEVASEVSQLEERIGAPQGKR